ncbi:hypothetical protein HDU93_002283 [Gonapodya sp. JEL0774]|nr:hypothetical protein HDU93_002283 [Gonapodya sp. JEL0774]
MLLVHNNDHSQCKTRDQPIATVAGAASACAETVTKSESASLQGTLTQSNATLEKAPSLPVICTGNEVQGLMVSVMVSISSMEYQFIERASSPLATPLQKKRKTLSGKPKEPAAEQMESEPSLENENKVKVTLNIPPKSLLVVLAPPPSPKILDTGYDYLFWILISTKAVLPGAEVIEGYWLEKLPGSTLHYKLPEKKLRTIDVDEFFLQANGKDPIVLQPGRDFQYHIETDTYNISESCMTQLIASCYALRCLREHQLDIRERIKKAPYIQKYKRSDIKADIREISDRDVPFPTSVNAGDYLVHIQAQFDQWACTTFFLAQVIKPVQAGQPNNHRMLWYRRSVTNSHSKWKFWSLSRNPPIPCELARDPKDPSNLLVLKEHVDFQSGPFTKSSHYGQHAMFIDLTVPTSTKGRSEYLQLASFNQHMEADFSEATVNESTGEITWDDGVERKPLHLGESLDCQETALFPSLRYKLRSRIAIPSGIDYEALVHHFHKE